MATDRLTDEQITEIYKKFVLVNQTEEYCNRYDPLPIHLSPAFWPWDGKDLPRVIATLEFDRFVKLNHLSSEKGLAINGLDPEWHYLPHQTIECISYLSNPVKYDLHTLDLEVKDFDFIMVNQTLEHVYHPLLCLKNVFDHLRSGGILYLNVPANNIPHDTPFHYYTGFTPVGLGVLVQLAGFKILSIGQFGNLEYLTKMHGAQRWPSYGEVSRPGINEFQNPIITWIFATKEE